MDERYIEHVSTESPELIRENECEYNIGTLVTYRFRRLWNEIVDLREQLDAARRTTPDSKSEYERGWDDGHIAGREKIRTTPDREAIIEECAKVCDEYAIDRFALFKGRKPYTGRERGRADPYYDGASDGADRCAQLIRELKTITPSPRDTLIEEIAEMVDHMGEGRRLEEYVGAIREMKGGNR